MTHQRFQRKTYGRIFVLTPAHVLEVTEIIQSLDPFEADYLPENLVTIFNPQKDGRNAMVYLHKFEIDKIALGKALLEAGILNIMIDGQEEFANL